MKNVYVGKVKDEAQQAVQGKNSLDACTPNSKNSNSGDSPNLIKAITLLPLHKKGSFPLGISSVSVTKSAVSHLLKKSLMENFIFCAVSIKLWQLMVEIVYK